jgi:hypothetical protein
LPGDDVSLSTDFTLPVVIDQPVTGINTMASLGLIEIHAGGSLSLNSANITGGVIRLKGGTVVGGSWRFGGSASAGFEAATGFESTLDGVVTVGNLNCNQPDARVRLRNDPRFTMVRVSAEGVTLVIPPGETIRWNLTSTAGGSEDGQLPRIEAESDGVVTVASQTRWFVDGGLLYIGTNRSYPGRMTFVNHGWIDGRQLRVVPAGFENYGTIGSSQTLLIEPTGEWINYGTVYGGSAYSTQLKGRWTNAGTIIGQTCTSNQAQSDSAVQLMGTWTNVGEIRGCVTFQDQWTNAGLVAGGNVQIRGNFTTAQLGDRFESLAVIRGRFDNTGSVATLPGGWYLWGGEFFGGSVVAPASELRGMSGSVREIEFIGDLPLDGLTVGAGVRCARGILMSEPCFVANGETLDFPVSVRVTLKGETNGIYAAEDGGSFTLGNSFVASAFPAFPGSSGTLFIGGTRSTVLHRGTILAKDGLSVEFFGNTIVNEGTLRSEGGGIGLRGEVSCRHTGLIESDGGPVGFAGTWTSTGPIIIRSAPPCRFRGSTTTASLRTIAKTATDLTFEGVIDNVGDELAMTAAMGDIRFTNSQIRGGTMRMQSGGRILLGERGIFTYITLDGVSVLDEMILDEPTISYEFTLRNSASVHSMTCQTNVNFVVASVQPWDFPIRMLGPTARVGFSVLTGVNAFRATSRASATAAALNGGALNFYFPQNVTFTNDASIDLRGVGSMTVTSGTLRQNGPMRFEGSMAVEIGSLTGDVPSITFAGPGGRLFLVSRTSSGATFPRLDAPQGTSVSLSGSWRCTGPITLSGGSLLLGGTYTLSSLSQLSRTSGSLALGGSLDLEGGSFAASAATGTIGCENLTVRNGTLHQIDGQRFSVNSGRSFSLRDTTVTSEVVVTGSDSTLTLLAGARVPGVRISSALSDLVLASGSVIDFPVVFDGAPGADRTLSTNTTGTLRIARGGSVEARGVSASIFSRSGSLTLTVEGTCSATGAGGLLNVNPLTLTNFNTQTGELSGGFWRAIGGGAIDFFGTNRTVLINSADVLLDGTAATSGDFGTLTANTGRLRLDNGRQIALATAVTSFVNSGTLELAAGTRLTVGAAGRAGTFAQTAVGRLVSEAGGVTPALTFGQIRAFGAASISGEFRGVFLSPFVPVCGSEWTIVDANQPVIGAFATDTSPYPTPTTVLAVNAEGNDVVARVSPLADFDRSGFVDFFDYADFSECFEGGQCGRAGTADVNRDGFLDFFDYTDFVVSFEEGC